MAWRKSTKISTPATDSKAMPFYTTTMYADGVHIHTKDNTQENDEHSSKVKSKAEFLTFRPSSASKAFVARGFLSRVREATGQPRNAASIWGVKARRSIRRCSMRPPVKPSRLPYDA